MTLTITVSIDDIEQSFVTTIPDDLTTPLAVVSKIMMAAIAETPSAEVAPRRRGPNKPKDSGEIPLHRRGLVFQSAEEIENIGGRSLSPTLDRLKAETGQ